MRASLLFLIVAVSASPAAEYHLNSAKGDDTQAGSLTQPWQSLTRLASAKLQPGDRVCFHAGSTWNGQLVVTAQGAPGQPILFQAHGTGPRPRIIGGAQHEDVVLLSNAQHVVVSDLEVTSTAAATADTNRPPRRGVHILAQNVGTLKEITVSNLYIHDIRGTQRIKHNGGIVFDTRGNRAPTRFDGLRIAHNIIWRVDRSGIVAVSSHASRTRWFPSTNVLISDNWIGDVGGDGITPWATDGCLVEHNIVEGANERAATYNAGIWPWSTDNTIMRLNRASGVKTLLDGQGFDSDYNSRNTLIEFNLSHDNEGGFLLVCTPGARNPADNLGNVGTKVRYNISRHDGARVLHMAGSAKQTLFEQNAIYVAAKADVQLLLVSDWSGWADDLRVLNNLFHAEGTARYGHQTGRNYQTGAYTIGRGWGPGTNITFQGNRYIGRHEGQPEETLPTSTMAPMPISFDDWPGPQFDPKQPDTFAAYIRAHRAWMLALMKRQFGRTP